MRMGTRRQPMPRVLPGRAAVATLTGLQPLRHDAPRLVCRTLVDFSALELPEDVRLALAEAFWHHFGIRSERSICSLWFDIKTFVRFARESGAVGGIVDLDRDLLARYIEWLNGQCRTDGRPWTKACRARTYTTLRTLLQWLERFAAPASSPVSSIRSIRFHGATATSSRAARYRQTRCEPF